MVDISDDTKVVRRRAEVTSVVRRRRWSDGEKTVAPPDTNCPCCQQPMHVIGEDTSERLDVIPAQYRVIVTRTGRGSPAGPASGSWKRRSRSI
jgi:transposase